MFPESMARHSGHKSTSYEIEREKCNAIRPLTSSSSVPTKQIDRFQWCVGQHRVIQLVRGMSRTRVHPGPRTWFSLSTALHFGTTIGLRIVVLGQNKTKATLGYCSYNKWSRDSFEVLAQDAASSLLEHVLHRSRRKGRLEGMSRGREKDVEITTDIH